MEKSKHFLEQKKNKTYKMHVFKIEGVLLN